MPTLEIKDLPLLRDTMSVRLEEYRKIKKEATQETYSKWAVWFLIDSVIDDLEYYRNCVSVIHNSEGETTQ